VACPTHDTAWTAGDDQPAPGPTYFCDGPHYAGTVSADGTSVTFKVTAQFVSTAGQMSLAIVPDVSAAAAPGAPANAPFAVDFNPPDEHSLSSITRPPAAQPEAQPYTPPVAAPYPPVELGAPLALPAVVPVPAPVTATQTTQPVPSSGEPAASQVGVATPAESLGTSLGILLGGLILLVAVVIWSLGYGLLGGRVIPLSVPLKRA
jgi:hypothetical protein